MLETLESRQLLAGPQLIGIQPNEGDLIVDGSVRDTAPRVLTLRFDEDQRIDAETLDGVQITRAGDDGQIGTDDDIRVNPGLVTLGDPNENEVVVRFAETLGDDAYRVEVFGFDDPGQGIIGLRNLDGDFLQPGTAGERSDVIDFDLQLGALIEGVVPQPVVRLDDGSLAQNRNEIVVFFNEDPLFTEDDDDGNPTARSVENPRFYQLFQTEQTVRTTDDAVFFPQRVVYSAESHTARLFFADDLNNLVGGIGGDPSGGSEVAGRTYRLRIGTAVGNSNAGSVDLVVRPTPVAVIPSADIAINDGGDSITFRSKIASESRGGRSIRFVDTDPADAAGDGLVASIGDNGDVIFDLRGDTVTVADLQAAVAAEPTVDSVISLEFDAAIGTVEIPAGLVGAVGTPLVGSGDTLGSAMDVGVFGQQAAVTSLILSDSINPQGFAIELPGGNTDPGHRQIPESAGGSFIQDVNVEFGGRVGSAADTLAGITEIAYNFNGIFDSDGPNSFINQITAVQKTRIREVLDLWSDRIGVQFRETVDEGLTIGVGTLANLQPVDDETPNITAIQDVSVRVDPSFANPAILLSNRRQFNDNYGEDLTRLAAASVGVILGLERATETEPHVLLNLNNGFLNASIDQLTDLEPVFPSPLDVLHGQHVHRPDANEVDLYRFEVDLDDADQVGQLTAETFAERLADSSLLDTSLTLFQEVRASAVSDFGLSSDLSIRFDAVAEGSRGNNSRIDFIQSDRGPGDDAIRIFAQTDSTGAEIANAFTVDIPRRNVNVTSVPVGRIVDAINADPLASTIVRASIEVGDATADVSGSTLAFSPVLLGGGGVERLSRNDDYFSEDSRIIATLGAGVYYVGVAASGNDSYNPTIPESGFGGTSQGRYDLHLKFEPAVDETEVIRDVDSSRAFVPGTVLDGDGDGVPGGVHNFWFQTTPELRTLEVNDDGAAIVPGQSVTITSADGIARTYEFVPFGSTPRPGNVALFYSNGDIGAATTQENLTGILAAAINARTAETGLGANPGVTATAAGRSIELSGERTLSFSSDFRGITAHGRTIFVDKLAGPLADGSLDRPFNNISSGVTPAAFAAALPGDIVRIVGNGGADGNASTEADNFSYQIGVADIGGGALEDGRTMEIPRDVTTMIDAGAILKLRNARIGVGSSTLQVDRSNGALQILGTPRLVDLGRVDIDDSLDAGILSDADLEAAVITPGEGFVEPAGGFQDGSVILTSLRDPLADAAAAGSSAAAAAGNWGGIVYRRDLDQAQGRSDLEDEGIFLNRVNHADIRYGGSSNLLIDSIQQLVNPIQIVNMRPTVTFNQIRFSADAAISAAPNSFEETSFQAPRFQQAGEFTADYARVGPEMHNNLLVENSINGVFIRVTTTPSESPRALTVAGRLDDTDIVHYLAENVVITGTPGGSIRDGVAPSMDLVSGRTLPGGQLAPGTYRYKTTLVDANGFESLASATDFSIDVTEANSSIELTGLPVVPDGTDYVSRRLYRALDDGIGGLQFVLVADLDSSNVGIIDDGGSSDGILDQTREGVRGRLDASLVLDPGLVVKTRGARFEFGVGTTFLAEGTASQPIVLTSAFDDRFGAGGTFDTNNDDNTPGTEVAPTRGDWSGIYASPNATVSLDNAVIAYAGGISLLEGGESRAFAPLELHQATARITNSRFEFNQDGQDGAGPLGRFGRLGVTPSTIFVRGSSPVIAGNDFIDNRGSTIDIDVDSMTADFVIDLGRQTGDLERLEQFDDNQGPLIRGNRFSNVPTDVDSRKQISGLEIRGGDLVVESVWDDTDIVHLLFDSVNVGNFHSSGGLTLKSRPDESLVVKLSGAGNPNGPQTGTGLTAGGTESDITDRIGGTIHVLGLPGAPVVLTSFQDDSVGAGLTPEGNAFTDNNGDSFGSRPQPNDWRSIFLDQFSNDRNFDTVLERELSTEQAPGLNGDVENAQFLGQLAPNQSVSDEQLRLGFQVQGFLAQPTDVDTYSFVGTPGTEVWIDIDQTSFTLDSVIELLDENGRLLARSDNSFAEIAGSEDVAVTDSDFVGTTTSLQAGEIQNAEFGAGGLYQDFGSTNPRDAGIHFSLPGNRSSAGATSVYFFRVRSASINPDDVGGGLTSGNYTFQVRLTEADEFGGSKVNFADIRYSNHGIHSRGLPGISPLLGEAAENETVGGAGNSNDQIDAPGGVLGNRAQYIGNLVNNRSNVISVAGELADAQDVDFFQVDINRFGQFAEDFNTSTVFDVDYAAGLSRPDTNLSVFFDPDGEGGGFGPQLVLVGQDSNILEDLASPFGQDSPLENLSRGSADTGDPLIGPVSLPEGTYYVAVTGDGVLPTELSSPNVRREPINSVQRIAEDRVEADDPSTVSGPLVTELFDDAVVDAGGFVVATDTQVGHGRPTHFDGTTIVNGLGGSSALYLESAIAGGDAASDTITTAVNLSDLDWSLDQNLDIGGRTDETSTTVPHLSIQGSLLGDQADFYEFTVGGTAPSRVILDVDGGINPLALNTDPTSVDTRLVLFGPEGATPVTTNISTFSLATEGGNGSDPGTFSLISEDPFLDVTLDPGTYWVGVLPQFTSAFFSSITDDVVITPSVLPTSISTYTLHVSADGQNVPAQSNNEVYQYVPVAGGAAGSLQTNTFSLAGYGAADLPRLYFNYNLGASGDNLAEVIVTSAENTAGTTVATSADVDDLIADNDWRQSVIELGDFAGHTDIQVEFRYTPGAAVGATDQLSLDDFVIGFAERGETVFGATPGISSFAGNSTTDSGKYQLEVRRGTQYSEASADGEVLTADFDTNDRHTQAITLVAPAGSVITDGQTFILGDGAAQQVFEFTDSPGTVAFGNTPVLFDALDTPAEVAESIATAIRNQTTLAIEASSSSGQDSGALSDGRLTLTGNAQGSLLSIGSIRNFDAESALTVDADGHVELPAIIHNGQGDSNFLRAQSQVIVDSNQFSDINAIGVWSEFGISDTDPEDRQFVTTPSGSSAGLISRLPLGNAYPGHARNLPVDNDEVIGGIAPGVVVVNNTFDHVGYTGIKVEGQTRPWQVQVPGGGDTVSDGYTMIIDSGGTRVVFEFEDIGDGAPGVVGGGSDRDGGDGYIDGHVPIFFRQTDDGLPTVYRNRGTAYDSWEMADAIADAIRGSILMSNGLAEIVSPFVGPSLTANDTSQIGGVDRAAGAVYLTGVSNIYFVDEFSSLRNLSQVSAELAPVAEPVQPFARIVNNTIYGEDGVEAEFSEPATTEPSDLPVQAIDTKIGGAHRSVYTAVGAIGDQTTGVDAAADVDMYKVELEVGDRLIVDIDTLGANPDNNTPAGPDTVIRIFNDRGFEQTFDAGGNVLTTLGESGTAQPHLNVGGTSDASNNRDPFADFTATEKGTYFVAISSRGNDSYDPSTVSGRQNGTGGTGNYTINLRTFTPRSFVISLDNGSTNDRASVSGATVMGSSFTVTQIADLGGTNVQTFTFSQNAGANLVTVQPDDLLPDIMVAIADALNDVRVLNNHARGNGPDGRSGPLGPAFARALGGRDGGNNDITFNRLQNQDGAEFGDGGIFNERGTTEQYVLLQGVAEIDVSGVPFMRVDPQPGRETDQLLNETGILLAGGSSASALNNVFLNLHESFVVERTNRIGFGQRFSDQFYKQSEVVLVGSVFQHDGKEIPIFPTLMDYPVRSDDIQTDIAASNLNGDTDDFNIVLASRDPALANAAGDNFQPAFDSILIDSSISSLVERDAFRALKNSVGLPVSNILAPQRDVFGVLRADNPNFAPPGGVGGSVFTDRGSTELADFVGPVAIANVPRDNDAEGLDSDPATSFIRLTEGTFEEFQIQLRDNGDSSDPFTGIGIDDNTVVVPVIEGLRPTGATFTLFENDQLLQEGIDYRFAYDETQNIVTLTPLAGVWQGDRAYRIAMNNRDRSVAVAPPAASVSDGDQLLVTDTNGGTLIFEFESGYQLIVPETLTLIVPEVGTNAGGVRDGDIFTINDGDNAPVVFEFNSDDATLPGSVPVPLTSNPTPSNATALDAFRATIATAIGDQIQAQVDAGNLDLDVIVDGARVVLGAESGATVDTTVTGLGQAARTLGLRIPSDRVVADGDTFTVTINAVTTTFEIQSGGGLTSVDHVPVNIAAGSDATVIANAIVASIESTELNLRPSVVTTADDGIAVYMNLPVDGGLTTASETLGVVGLRRTTEDGDLIRIRPTDGADDVVLEVNRLDEPGVTANPDGTTGPGDDGVTAPNLAINITRASTADDIASQIIAVLGGQEIAGIDTSALLTDGNGLVAVGGTQGLDLTVSGDTLEVVGEPSVTGSSTLDVLGDLLLELPVIGGVGIADGSVLILQDDTGNDVIFEFNVIGTALTVNGSTAIPYNPFDASDAVATAIADAINGRDIGITATNLNNGTVSLGRIAVDRVNTVGNADQGLVGATAINSRRGIVTDGETLTIRQGDFEATFEFESVVGGGGVQAGNVAVPFQPGSTPGDVAVSLAAAINNNRGSLDVNAVAVTEGGVTTGRLILNDRAGTVIEVRGATAAATPSLVLSGVPGGAVPVTIVPGQTDGQLKDALIAAINSVNQAGEPAVTTLTAEDRGGNTFFIENAATIEGVLTTYFLPGIKDRAGNDLEPNRPDRTTQFTILMPTVALDYGDAPDPRESVPGRYPTSREFDGARHIVDQSLKLGTKLDANADGLPNVNADGDDATLSVESTSGLFSVAVVDGRAEITVADVDPTLFDGDTIVIDTGVDRVTLEVDLNERFDEDSFPIQLSTASTAADVPAAILAAVAESGLQLGGVSSSGLSVVLDSDDEDGVVFVGGFSALNHDVTTLIDVTVTGGGVLEGWVDFNADGDFDDPNEQIITAATPGARFSDDGSVSTRRFDISLPETAPTPISALTTYARFRLSREGGLSPTGLALSGEVEDYRLSLLPGSPPNTADRPTRSFTTDEDLPLQALDVNGTLTSGAADDGILAGVVDPDGDPIAIAASDVGTRTVFGEDPLSPGTPITAGVVNIQSDGTFTFTPEPDFNGSTQFTVSVTDVQPGEPELQLVSSTPITVSIDVQPVNDRPTLVPVTAPEIRRTTTEDTAIVFGIDELVTPFFTPGPANEQTQGLIFRNVGSDLATPFTTSQGGSVSISADGRSVTYTPPANRFGGVADSFLYEVADVPGAGQVAETASNVGTVLIDITGVNDPPIAADFLRTGVQSGESIRINVADVLADDRPGPENEVATQSVSLVPGQFVNVFTTANGGTVFLSGAEFRYTAPESFSGIDTFTYQIQDSATPPAVATGRVQIQVDGTANAPVFVGVNGQAGVSTINLTEGKTDPQVVEFDLNTWFIDPERMPVTFTATSADGSRVAVRLTGAESNILELTVPPLTSGQTEIMVTATDVDGNVGTTTVTVDVANTPDPPVVANPLGSRTILEDQVLTIPLSTVFSDPDGDVLTYSLSQLRGIFSPTQANIDADPLINSVSLSGDTLVVTLEPDASGTVQLEISATDAVGGSGGTRVSSILTLNVQPAPDAPVAVGESFTVGFGDRVQELNPAAGLLANDSDADGEALTIDLASVTTPTEGTVQVNADGTFVYNSVPRNLAAGESRPTSDSFSYRVRDASGQTSNTVTVQIALATSAYQNPGGTNFHSDVNADGFVTPLDALLVINFLATQGNAGSVPISEISAPPPNFYDVNGSGAITPSDALSVINFIAANNTASGGEQITAFATSSEVVAPPTTSNVLQREFAPLQTRDESVSGAAVSASDATDRILSAGVEISTAASAEALQVEWADSEADSGDRVADVDSVLASMFDDKL